MLIFMASPTPLDCLQHSLLATIYHKEFLQRYEQHFDINLIKKGFGFTIWQCWKHYIFLAIIQQYISSLILVTLKPNRMRGLDFTSLWITLTPTNCMRYNPGHCIYLSLDLKIGSCNPSSLLPPLQLSSAPTVARLRTP